MSCLTNTTLCHGQNCPTDLVCCKRGCSVAGSGERVDDAVCGLPVQHVSCTSVSKHSNLGCFLMTKLLQLSGVTSFVFTPRHAHCKLGVGDAGRSAFLDTRLGCTRPQLPTGIVCRVRTAHVGCCYRCAECSPCHFLYALLATRPHACAVPLDFKSFDMTALLLQAGTCLMDQSFCWDVL
jgi:hypothetical protein